MNNHNEFHQRIVSAFRESVEPITKIRQEYLNSASDISALQAMISEASKPARILREEIDSSALFTAVNVLKTSIDEITKPISSMRDSFPYQQWTTALIRSMKEITSPINSSSNELNAALSSISDNLHISQGVVEIPSFVLDNLAEVIDLPENNKTVTESASPASVSFSFKEFFFIILLPILSLVCPLIQTHYYEARNALESQKEAIKTEAYREQLLEIEQKQLDSINSLSTQIQAIVNYLYDNQENEPLSEDFPQSLVESGHASDSSQSSDQSFLPDTGLSVESDIANDCFEID